MSEQGTSIPKIGNGQAAGEGGINLGWYMGRGPLGAFAPKIAKLNTKSPSQGEGVSIFGTLGRVTAWGRIQRFPGFLRQIFSSGVGGLNLRDLGALDRTWSHAHIFFPGGGGLIDQTGIKPFKHRVLPAQVRSLLFEPAYLFSEAVTRAPQKNCREIQDGGVARTPE